MDDVRKFLALPAHGAPTGKGVRVAVIDTGIDRRHPDIRPGLDRTTSVDFSESDFGLRDVRGHGTHIAGIVAGRGIASNGQYEGVARDATLAAIKLTDDGRWNSVQFIKALEHALEDAEVDIINFSLGLFLRKHKRKPPWIWGPTPHQRDVFNRIAERGILFIASAGNEGPESGTINWPAGLEDVVAVAGVTLKSGRLTCDSSRGPFRYDPTMEKDTCICFDESRTVSATDPHLLYHKPDVAAPGYEIMAPRSEDAYLAFPYPTAQRKRAGHERLTGSYNGLYKRATGTSQAAAVVSGLAACLLQYLRDSGLKLDGADRAQTLRQILIEAADREGRYHEHQVGAGVLRWPAIAHIADKVVQARLGG